MRDVSAVEAAIGGSTDRSLRLLALLAESGKPLSLAELADALALPKTTVHRLCGQLLASGHVARDAADRSFAVGPALNRLARDVLANGVLRSQRRDVLAALVDEVGETCNFTALDGTRVLYLDRVEAQWPLRMTLEIGSHVPLHCTASGKLFLAMMPAARRKALLAKLPLARMTPSTIVDPGALAAECEAIAGRGYARDDQEFIAGLIAVAVPVSDDAGPARAAIAVHAPVARMSLAAAETKLDPMRVAAERMRGLM